MNDAKVKPALTAQEWANPNEYGSSGQQWYIDMEVGVVDVRCDRPEDWHALAALALHGRPFGFTREDVRNLRTMIDEATEYGRFMETSRERMASSLADRIEALLPPEAP